MSMDAVRRIDAAGAAAVAALTAAAYFGGLSPLSKARAAREDAAVSIADERAEASSLASSALSLQRKLEQVQREVEGSAVRLLPASQVNQRLDALTKLADGEGLLVERIQRGTVSAHARYGTVTITLEGRGTYARLAVFLGKLNTTFRDLGVRSLEVVGAEHPGQIGSFAVDLVWYVLPPEQAG